MTIGMKLPKPRRPILLEIPTDKRSRIQLRQWLLKKYPDHDKCYTPECRDSLEFGTLSLCEAIPTKCAGPCHDRND